MDIELLPGYRRYQINEKHAFQVVNGNLFLVFYLFPFNADVCCAKLNQDVNEEEYVNYD